MDKLLIICSSHLYMPTVLSYILNNNNHHYYLYTDNTSINELFIKSNLNVSVICEPKGVTIWNPWRLISFKRNIFKRINELQIDSLLFFHDGYCMPANWIIKRMSKSKKILYCPLYNDRNTYKKSRTFLAVMDMFLNYLIWNVTIDPRKVGSLRVPYLSDSFFRSINYSKVTINVDFELLRTNIDIICPHIKYKQGGIVILQSELVGKYIDSNKYEKIINNIIESIGANNCCFKGKPGRERLFGKESELTKIPSYISANLIIDRFVAYIGTTTTVLAEAANAGIKAYSLLKIIHPEKEEDTNMYISYLKTLSDYIIFPDSVEELIKSLKRNILKNNT